MTVSMMVFICLVSFGGLGESFSAGGRPRLFLALEPPSSLPERSLSWRLLRLRFFSRISSSISSRFPSSIAWKNKEATDLIAITQSMQDDTIGIAYKCYETTTTTLHLIVQQSGYNQAPLKVSLSSSFWASMNSPNKWNSQTTTTLVSRSFPFVFLFAWNKKHLIPCQEEGSGWPYTSLLGRMSHWVWCGWLGSFSIRLNISITPSSLDVSRLWQIKKQNKTLHLW